MSKEDVEIVRRSLDAFNRRDWDGVLKDTTPDYELDLSRGVGPFGGVYRGDQAKGLFSDFGELWASLQIEPDEFIEAGEHVVVPWTFSATGRDGIGVEAHVTWTFTVREGKVARMAYFPTRKEALDAARLSEQAMSQENVEIVRRAMEQYGDLEPIETPQFVDQFFDPEGDYYPVRKFPGARPCHGREEIARFHAEYLDTWDRWEYAIKRLIAVGDDRVFAHATVHAEGRESGMKLDSDLYFSVWLRQGRVFRWEDHLTLPGALNALGLSGETLEAAGLRE